MNTGNKLVPSQSYSGHASMESALPSVEDARVIVYALEVASTI